MSENAPAVILAWSPSSQGGTALPARAVAWLLDLGGSCQMRAPNCPNTFQTGLLGVVCLVTFEKQPVRDVVRLLAAVMLVVGGSRISVTALGRLVGLGAPPFGAAPIVNFNRTSTTTTTTTVCNALLKACMKTCHQVRSRVGS